jgi:hypothetical protein
MKNIINSSRVFDSTVLLAILTSAIYIWGCVYLETFYGTFGIRYEWLEFTTSTVLLAAFEHTMYVFIFFILLMFASAGYSLLSLDYREWPKYLQWIKFMEKSYHETWGKFGDATKLLVVFMLYICAGVSAGNQGERDAIKIISNPLHYSCTVDIDGKSRSDLNFLTHNAGNYYFFKKLGKSFELIILPKEKITNLTRNLKLK